MEKLKHIAIDMQRLVAEHTAWHSPAVMRILPNVLKLSKVFRGQSLYARFVAPKDVGSAAGSWKKFYCRWPMILGDELEPALLDLVGPLAELAQPDQIFDKLGYSVFSNGSLDMRLRNEGIETLVLSGIETDVCVYSSALAAVDLGYSVVLASDAIASPSDEAHFAVLDLLANRLPDQIEVMTTAEIVAAMSASAD